MREMASPWEDRPQSLRPIDTSYHGQHITSWSPSVIAVIILIADITFVMLAMSVVDADGCRGRHMQSLS